MAKQVKAKLSGDEIHSDALRDKMKTYAEKYEARLLALLDEMHKDGIASVCVVQVGNAKDEAVTQIAMHVAEAMSESTDEMLKAIACVYSIEGKNGEVMRVRQFAEVRMLLLLVDEVARKLRIGEISREEAQAQFDDAAERVSPGAMIQVLAFLARRTNSDESDNDVAQAVEQAARATKH